MKKLSFIKKALIYSMITLFLGSGIVYADRTFSLPNQTGQSGEFLSTNGTNPLWATVGGGVTSLNALTGAITLSAGTSISLTPSGNNIAIAHANPLAIGANIGNSPNPQSLLYAGLAGTLSNSPSLQWDVNNNRLGIGTSTPVFPLDVNGIARATTLYTNSIVSAPDASGTDVSGTTVNLTGGKATGNATGGSVHIQTSTPTSSG